MLPPRPSHPWSHKPTPRPPTTHKQRKEPGTCRSFFTFTPFASSGDGFNLSATVKDGEPWFIAADVCRSLGLDRSAVRRLDDDEKGVRTMHTPAGVINESGLYSLIFSSRKESAKRFKKWVTSVVLPSLRKHGGYINGQEALRPESQAEVLQVVQETARRARSELGEEHRDRFSPSRRRR